MLGELSDVQEHWQGDAICRLLWLVTHFPKRLLSFLLLCVPFASAPTHSKVPFLFSEIYNLPWSNLEAIMHLSH